MELMVANYPSNWVERNVTSGISQPKFLIFLVLLGSLSLPSIQFQLFEFPQVERFIWNNDDVYSSLQQYKHDYVISISHATVTSHEHHGVSSHGQLECSFNRLLRPNKENIKSQHYMPWGIHRWLGWCVATPPCSSSLLQKILILNEDIYEVTA